MDLKRVIVNVPYLCIHKKIEERANRMKIIRRREIFQILGRTFHIPKKLLYPTLKEMQHLNLIECLNSMEIKVLKSQINIKDVSKIQRKLRFF